MQRMGEAFVLGRDIEEAPEAAPIAAPTAPSAIPSTCWARAPAPPKDAEAYLEAYLRGHQGGGRGGRRRRRRVRPRQRFGEALGPASALRALAGRPGGSGTHRPASSRLARLAKAAGVGLTVDAEEAERLEMSLDIIDGAARDPSLGGWDGLGMAVQAYQRRAPAVIGWAERSGRRHRAAADGPPGQGRLLGHRDQARRRSAALPTIRCSPARSATDVSYMACARALLAATTASIPAFATHNALTVATVMEWAGDAARFRIPAPARHGRWAL